MAEINHQNEPHKHQALLDALGDTDTLNHRHAHVRKRSEHNEDDPEEEIPLDSPPKTYIQPLADPPLNAPVQGQLFPSESDHQVYGTFSESSSHEDNIYIPKANNNTSISSETPRKLRPESALLPLTKDPILLTIALVAFHHALGPHIEFHEGPLLSTQDQDEEILKLLPFLALPDGAHQNQEDYSYFHLVPSKARLDAVPVPKRMASSDRSSELSPTNLPPQSGYSDPLNESQEPSSPNTKYIPAKVSRTIFGISCNRQIASSELLVKGEDVTRSTVQKAVVILASKPVFGPIRDKLGVVTRAFFNQRDFTETDILVDFYKSLEISLRSQLTESAFYMGTSIRELIHTFRQRTLTLVKALMLQRKIVFYGHPVEKLCIYQYSLISLFPGLLQTLEDSGSPILAERAKNLGKPNELKTSDRKSLMAFLGMPLDLFGKDAFFQPYLPLQQIDMLSAQSGLCGATNSIVTQHKEIDILVNIETCQIEYRTPHVERMVALTAADRKWIGDVVDDVGTTWNENDPQRPTGMQFKGSDDYLRTKFEEYITAALSAVKYRVYQERGSHSVLNTGEPNTSYEDFGELFLNSFQATNAYEVWDRITDPVLFDIIEPKHPCEGRPNIVSDFGLRLSEGLTDLHLDQQLAPTREALTNVFSVGSSSFFKAVEGVRGGVTKVVSQRQGSFGIPSFASPFNTSNAVSPNPPDAASPQSQQSHPLPSFPPSVMASTSGGERKLRPLSLASMASISSTNTNATNVTAASTTTGEGAAGRGTVAFSAWGSTVGSWMGSKASRLRESVSSITSAGPSTNNASTPPTQPESRMSVTSLAAPGKGGTSVGNSASSALFGLAAARPGEETVGPTPTSSTFSPIPDDVSSMPTPSPNK